MVQYYPRTKLIRLAICDLGIGIPTGINSYLLKNDLPLLSDYDAVIKSTEKYFTTKSIPRNLGLGLDSLKTNVSMNGGTMTIMSNSASVRIVNHTDEIFGYHLPKKFDGTIIDFSLNPSMFIEEEEYVDDDFVW